MDAISSTTSAASAQAMLTLQSSQASFRKNATMDSIDKTAKDFESMFLTQMLQPMFETVAVDSEFGGGHGEEMMRGFMVQEFGKTLAETQQFGLADAIKSRMFQALKTQKTQSSPTIEVKA